MRIMKKIHMKNIIGCNYLRFVGKEGLSEKVTIIRDGAAFHWGMRRDYWWKHVGEEIEESKA